jgi:mannitol-1-/sugar-/sorbitol-6-/2-deoxyglucose-6-phosphatase
MQLNSVIFDMDGLLVDTEPLWHEAANEIFGKHGVLLTPENHAATTGLRTKEFIQWWFPRFGISTEHAATAEKEIVALVIQKFLQKGKALPGVAYIFNFFQQRNFKIGIATSSGMELVNTVINFLQLPGKLDAIVSGAELPYAKPHPQVFIDCAAALNVSPENCVCFEDSFNGMIAAKAARMKCVMVPAYSQLHNTRWQAADLKISSLQNFNELLLQGLQ